MLFSFIFYTKEGNKQNLKCINKKTYDEAKAELNNVLESHNLNIKDSKKYEEIEGTSLILVFSDNIILKIESVNT